MPLPPTALAIARALIAFPSVTPADAGALPYLRDLLAGAGFSAELVTFSAPGTPDVLNLYARFGTRGAEPRLRRPHRRRSARRCGALAVSAVLGRGRRRTALGPRRLRHEGRARGGGRGGARLRRARARSRARSAFSSPATRRGRRSTARQNCSTGRGRRGERFDHCIVGEPTSVEALGDTIKNGRRGSLTGRLTLHGRRATSPIRISPTIRCAGWPRCWPPCYEPPLDAGSADFDPSNLEVVTVDVGNPATNVIPGRGPARVQRPLQRPLDAGDAEGRDRAPDRGAAGESGRR